MPRPKNERYFRLTSSGLSCRANLIDTLVWPKLKPDELGQDQREGEREWCAHFNKTAQSWGNDESAWMQISSQNYKASYGSSIEYI